MSDYTDADVIAARDALVRDTDYERLNPLSRQYAGRIAERLVAAMAPAMRDRWADQIKTRITTAHSYGEYDQGWNDAIRSVVSDLRSGGDQ